MGNVAVVTGAGTGIGRSTAERLGARGLTVVAVGRTAATLADTVAAIRAAGGAAEAVVADVGSESDLDRVVAQVGDRPVAALVHSAANHISTTYAETTRSDFDEQVAVNFAAPFFLTQTLLANFVDNAGVVFVGSITSARARDRHIAYAATKAALVGLTVQLAAELAPAVRVNCVSPGPTKTAMLNAYVEEATKHRTEEEQRRARIADKTRILLNRVAEPDEVAATIVHLALDATAVTGVELPVDVGYRAS